jgi:hypothetical protein
MAVVGGGGGCGGGIILLGARPSKNRHLPSLLLRSLFSIKASKNG